MFTTVLDALQTGRKHIMSRLKSLCTSQADLLAAVPAEPNKTHSSTTCSHRTRTDLPSKSLPHFLLLNIAEALLRQKQQDTPGSVDPNHRTPTFMWEISLSVSSDPPIWTYRACPGQSQQCGTSAHFGRTPSLLGSTRLRSGLVNRNTLCVRSTSGQGGLKYPVQIQSLEKVSSLLRKKSFQHLREEGRRRRYISCETNTWQKHAIRRCQHCFWGTASAVDTERTRGQLTASKLSQPHHRESNQANSIHLFQTGMFITACSLPRKL